MKYLFGVWAYFVISWILLIYVDATTDDICRDQKISVYPDADAKLSVILPIRYTEDDGQTCGQTPSSFHLRLLMLIQWAVDRINQADFIPGVKLGFDIYDDCAIERFCVAAALDASGGYDFGSFSCRSNNESLNLGILGIFNSQMGATVLDVLEDTDFTVLSPSATNPDLANDENFFRTTPTDLEQASAIVGLLQKLDWTYIAAVHTDDNYGTKGIQEVIRLAKEAGICVDTVAQLTTTGRNDGFDQEDEIIDLLLSQQTKAKSSSLGVIYFGQSNAIKRLLIRMDRKGNDLRNIHWIMSDYVGTSVSVFEDLGSNIGYPTFTLTQSSVPLTEAKNSFISKWNRVLQGSPSDTIESLISCLGVTGVPDWSDYLSMPVLDAVYAYASAFRRRVKSGCVTGVCPTLDTTFDSADFTVRYSDIGVNVTVPEYALLNRNITMDEKGNFLPDMSSSLYDVNIYKHDTKFSKIGEFKNGGLFVNSSVFSNSPLSECGGTCQNCLSKPEVEFSFLDGEVYIVAFISLHEAMPDNPFLCDHFRTDTQDIIVLETFFNTVKSMRAETGIWFGAIVFDDCYSSARLTSIVSRFMSGELTLYKPDTKEKIDVTKVLAYISAVSSGVTIPLGLLLSKLGIPLVSSTASSPDLDDRINFPYFLRTVPSDKEQAKAMVEIIKRMGWKYVSAVHVQNNYGSKGINEFMDIANQSGICVANTPLGIKEHGEGRTDLYRLLTDLRTQQAEVVVYFGTENRIVELVTVMKEEYDSRDIKDDFIFLSSEDWGAAQYLIDLGKEITRGSLTIKLETLDTDTTDLKNKLQNLNPVDNTENVWLKEFWTEYFKCYMEDSFDRKYPATCSPNLRLNSSSIDQIVKHQRVLHVITATKAVAKGLKAAKEGLCKFELVFPCDNYFRYTENVVAFIGNVTLERSSGQQERIFRDDRNGKIGFEILNVQQKSANNFEYVKAGTYEEDREVDDLILDKQLLTFYDHTGNENNPPEAQCKPVLCRHCIMNSGDTDALEGNETTLTVVYDGFTTPDFVVIGILGFLVVLMILLIVVILVCARRRLTALQNEIKVMSDLQKKLQSGPYANVNGTTVIPGYNASSLVYPEIMFNNGISGESLREWREAQAHLQAQGHIPNGFVNQQYIGRDSYSQQQNGSSLHANGTRNASDQSINSVHSRMSNNVLPDTPHGQTTCCYSLQATNSFKTAPVHGSTGSLAQVKKQPITQLAVNPNRPDLPPRVQPQTHSQRPTDFPADLNSNFMERPKHVKTKHRNTGIKRTHSSPEPKSLNSGSSTPSRSPRSPKSPIEVVETPSPSHMTFKGDPHLDDQMNSTNLIRVGNSLEKVSRV